MGLNVQQMDPLPSFDLLITWTKKRKKEKKERGEIDGQLRTWEKGPIYYSIKIYVLNWAKTKKKKVKGVLLQDHKSSTILSVFYPKMNNKKPK